MGWPWPMRGRLLEWLSLVWGTHQVELLPTTSGRTDCTSTQAKDSVCHRHGNRLLNSSADTTLATIGKQKWWTLVGEYSSLSSKSWKSKTFHLVPIFLVWWSLEEWTASGYCFCWYFLVFSLFELIISYFSIKRSNSNASPWVTNQNYLLSLQKFTSHQIICAFSYIYRNYVGDTFDDASPN